MSDSDRYCTGCDTEFQTLTKYRLHDCDNHQTVESDLDTEHVTDAAETYSFEGEVETWEGNIEATSTGSVSEQASGRECALCQDGAVVSMSPPIEWKRILQDQHDKFNPVSGHEEIPLCPECDIRVEHLRDGEKDIGYLDDEAAEAIETERLEILRSLDPDAIFANPPSFSE